MDDFSLPDGWILHENMTQGDLERFEVQMDKETKPSATSLATRARLNAQWVRAAIRAGWFQSCPYKPDELDKQVPAEIAQAAIAVSATYYEATTVPEKKS